MHTIKYLTNIEYDPENGSNSNEFPSTGAVEAFSWNRSDPNGAMYSQRCEEQLLVMGLRGLTVLFAAGDDGIGSFYLRDDPHSACSEAYPEVYL